MQAEQQQRILGYFIEEAQDHLDTIEQGLLNLQSTIEDPDLLYEVYRAAHSVKGGAAMLGLTSIQTTSHRLEDSFKILEKIQAQSRVQVDQELVSSFLEISDTLKAQIESLSSPYGLTDEIAQSQLQKVEPTFIRLNQTLESLAKHHQVFLSPERSSPDIISTRPAVSRLATEPIIPTSKPGDQSAKKLFFQSDVPQQLREMLQLFKQPENADSRKALIENCRSLARAGETFDLSQWSQFIATVEQAIANPQNVYSTLAPITIKAIKHAAEMVLENREAELDVSPALKALLPQSSSSTVTKVKPHAQVPIKVAAKQQTHTPPRQQQSLERYPESDPTDADIDLSFLENWSVSESPLDASKPTPRGPEIAPEELKSLADLFEGENSIGRGWTEEKLIDTQDDDASRSSDLSLDHDFLDLFGEDFEEDSPSSKIQEVQPQSPISKTPSRSQDLSSDFDDLLDIGTGKTVDSPQARLTSTAKTTPSKSAENLSFDDLFASSHTEVSHFSTNTQVEGNSFSSTDDSDWFEQLINGDVEPEKIPENLSTKTAQTQALASDQLTQNSPEDLFDDLFDSIEEEISSENQPILSPSLTQSPVQSSENFEDLEQLLNSSVEQDSLSNRLTSDNLEPSDLSENPDLFSDLDALLQTEEDLIDSDQDSNQEEEHEFDELERLLEGRGEESNARILATRTRVGAGKPQRVFEQTAKVPVKQLDNLSNLMGELVVNRNSLEQDQDRMRQFLDNLLDQVSLLSDVGQRMQDFYERSLLEISLLSGRKSSVWNSPRSEEEKPQKNRIDDPISRLYDDFESTELDRFTPFHTLSQEIIELVVRVRESAADIEFLVEEADQVTRQLRQVTTQLEEGLTKARMEPFAQEADRLARPVRDISIKCGKQAQLHVEGRDTLIDKMLLGKLHDPLIHLVNNAITHGIEPLEIRASAGKPPNGRIAIKVFHQGNQTVISISDDGAGIDVEKVKEKAIRKGLITPEQASSMSHIDVYDLLFHPGFSMKDQADEFAGRGVGMDVVRTSLNEIRGTITTDSTLGKGTTFTIRLPLNMSISRALCCISDRARIAFPMDGVEEMIDIPREQIRIMADGKQALEWRGSLLPFRHLRDLLTYKRHLGRGNVYGTNTEEDMISVIVLRSAGTYLAVMVDQVLAEQEIVIKQLEGPVPKPVGVAGATVLGDGQIVAIADVLELIDLAMGRIRKEPSPWPTNLASAPEQQPQKTQPTVLIVDDSITVRSLLSITFEKSGYRVEEARDGKEAWEKLKSGLPCDLVFCDIEMPRMDGLELLSRMQKDPALIDLPIAMLTSRGADRHRQMAYQLGARGYFTKPYLEEQLLEAAGRMLRGEVVGKPTGMVLPS